MPQDLEGFEAPNTLIEYRGIRGGERGDKAPIKTPPRVRMPVKNTSTKKFDVDVDLMVKIARRLKLKNPDSAWASDVKSIPVYLLSDEVRGEDGVVFLEKALYTGRGRLCASAADAKMARQAIDVSAYAKNKTIKELPQVKEVECTPDCPLWGKPDKPTDCKWRAIVTVQLQDSPVFPSPTRHRTRSKYSIRAMLTSLQFIKDTTGGVLMGIPLMFRQAQIDVRDATGKDRRIPIMYFDFEGTIQELREYAAVELMSRRALKDALDGKEVKTLSRKSFASVDLGGGETIIDEPEDRVEEEELIVGGDEPSDQNLELQSKIAMLYRQLQFTPARRKAVEAKHGGDLESLYAELKNLVPAGFNPSPGEPGEEEEEEPEATTSEASVDDDLDDDLFD